MMTIVSRRGSVVLNFIRPESPHGGIYRSQEAKIKRRRLMVPHVPPAKLLCRSHPSPYTWTEQNVHQSHKNNTCAVHWIIHLKVRCTPQSHSCLYAMPIHTPPHTLMVIKWHMVLVVSGRCFIYEHREEHLQLFGCPKKHVFNGHWNIDQLRFPLKHVLFWPKSHFPRLLYYWFISSWAVHKQPTQSTC